MEQIKLYINKETGEVLTFKEARKQFIEEYDGDDETNIVGFNDIYEYFGLGNI